MLDWLNNWVTRITKLRMKVIEIKPNRKIKISTRRSPNQTKIIRMICPPKEHVYLIRRIVGSKPDQPKEGQKTAKINNFSAITNEYKDVVEYIYNNSDGIKIPLNKDILDRFDITRRKLQNYKKQMVLDNQLIMSTPTTQILNANYDWDEYFML